MPIPKEVKAQLSKMKRMESCESCGTTRGKIEWHHALQYANKSVQEVYAIRALCVGCHRGNNGTIDRYADLVSKINAIQDGLKQLKAQYTKRNWDQQLMRLTYDLTVLKEKRDEFIKARLNGHI